jgi:hypothetical protein
MLKHKNMKLIDDTFVCEINFLQVHCQANLCSFPEWPLLWDSRLLVIPLVSVFMSVLLGSSIARPTEHLLDEGG